MKMNIGFDLINILSINVNINIIYSLIELEDPRSLNGRDVDVSGQHVKDGGEGPFWRVSCSI